MYNPTRYYVRVSRAEIFTGTGPSSQAPGLSSWVELPEVLDVPGVLDGYPVLCLQARGARPGDMDDLERASHMGESLCNPSLESTRLRARSSTSSVLERTLWQ